MRYCIVGCGRIARRHTTSALATGLEIAALCDVNREKATALASELMLPAGAKPPAIYKDFSTMLERERPDLLAIATDSGSHAEIAIHCAKLGIPAIVEKPLALSSEQAERICRLSFESGVPVAVCHQNRFNPAITALKSAISKGRLGSIQYGAAAVRWHRGASYYAQSEWRGRWSSDGGVLMNQCIHAADMLIHLLGRPEDVIGFIRRKVRPIEAEDLGAAIITFEGGRTAILEGTSLIEPENLEETIFLAGTGGSARLGGVAMNSLCLCSGGGGETVVVPDTAKDIYGGGHLLLYKDMLSAIEQGDSPSITAEDGRLAVELVLAIYRSAKLGSIPVGFMDADFSSVQMNGYFK